MTDDRTFSLVIPCYNEAPGLPALVDRVVEAAGRRGMGPDRFRLVLVENGSKDDSRDHLAPPPEDRHGGLSKGGPRLDRARRPAHGSRPRRAQ